MTTAIPQLAGTRVLLTGPLTSDAHIDAMLEAAWLLEEAGAIVLHPLAPEYPANHPELFGAFDVLTLLAVEASCIQAAELLVLLPGWEESSTIADVFTAEAAGVGWVEFDRLPLELLHRAA